MNAFTPGVLSALIAGGAFLAWKDALVDRASQPNESFAFAILLRDKSHNVAHIVRPQMKISEIIRANFMPIPQRKASQAAQP
jgi:hypothetical protein